MSSSRERFEAWCAVNCSPGGSSSSFYWSIWQAAERSRDAEVAELVEALRDCDDWLRGEGDIPLRQLLPKIDALLREYDGEKRDGLS